MSITIEQNVITVIVETQPPAIDVVITPPAVIDIEISNQAGIPAGGLEGQFLRKQSENNYDAGWSSSSASYYLHNQVSEAIEWIINHNLGRYPVMSILSIGSVEVTAEITHISANQSRAYFAQPCRGLAQCV